MHVFVLGATGAIGRATIPLLLAAGHRVTGLARSPDKLLQLDRMGVELARGDILDEVRIAALLKELTPHIVINLASAFPLRLKIDPKDWEQNDRIRSEGSRALVRACEAAGVKLLVQASVGYVCEASGNEWITEQSSTSSSPFVAATLEMENVVRAAGVPAVLLRLGALVSADSWHTKQTVAALRRGMLPIIGDGDSYVSTIHVEDAAAAIALTAANPTASAGKTYHVADNEPGTMGAVFRFAAERLGAPKPKSVPLFLAKLAVGNVTVDILAASYRMSNAAIREELGFAPRFPSYRETWTQVAESIAQQDLQIAPDAWSRRV